MIVALRILKLIGWAILLWAALIIIATSGKAQSAERILQQATRAQGGHCRKRMRCKHKGASRARAMAKHARFCSPRHDRVRMRWGLDFDGFILGEGSNGKSGWRRDSDNGLRTLTGRESLDFQTAATFRNQRWLEHKKQKAKLIAEATTTLNGKPVNVLNFVTHRGLKFKLFFDAA